MSISKKHPIEWKYLEYKKALSVLKDGTHFSPKLFGGKNLYITSKNIRMGKLVLDDVCYIPDDEHQRIHSACPVKFGDVLLTKDGAKTGNVCLNTLEEEFSLLSSVAYLRGRTDLLLNDYLLQWLSSPRVQFDIKNDMAGQAITRLTLQKIGKFKILLPPLLEQEAIADLLSTWDKAIEKTERLIKAKEKRFKWLLRKLISDNEQLTTKSKGNASGWKKVKLGDVVSVITSNVDKRTSPEEKRIHLCNYMDVYKNYYITSELDFMEASATSNEIKKFQLRLHDVLLTKDSETPDDIANSACVLDAPENLLCGYHLAILRPQKHLFGPYLNFALHTPKIRYEFSRQANGATRFGLTMSAYNMVGLPLPPFEKQQQIASTLSIAQQEIDLLKQLVEKRKTQKRGLMQKMLTGIWRVKPEIVRQYEEV